MKMMNTGQQAQQSTRVTVDTLLKKIGLLVVQVDELVVAIETVQRERDSFKQQFDELKDKNVSKAVNGKNVKSDKK